MNRGGYRPADGGESWGYRPADGNEPVARARRVKRRPREQSAEWLNFPEAMLRICPGYPTAEGGESWWLPARRRR
ncbi:TPA: hypothetical protein NIU89_000533 [Klebsiella oxytoca]|uniref:hypothetical protein n=1 Tax=Klebsiella oxytoca TaxID=571 RepID=UPI0011E7EEE7|nr:hypothetical protein [Klebsiella oxytoca]MBG2597436.1 hypothetical protein [Klebsiella oxytoca]HCF8090897.1 hypothetical protein [Klebsiella oxytoca]HCQ8422263.1 hypothetical protein [Klebsiella oxytoca]HEG4386138.1 hypothetical protein [Klebsiella oxytoca]